MKPKCGGQLTELRGSKGKHAYQLKRRGGRSERVCRAKGEERRGKIERERGEEKAEMVKAELGLGVAGAER